MEVYIVTRGDYSYYHIVAVFTELDAATWYVERLNEKLHDDERIYDMAEVEVWEADTPGLVPGSTMPYYVQMNRNGDSDWVKLQEWPGKSPEPLSLVAVAEGKSFILTGHVMAKSRQHAAKIANERRAQLIANGDWP